MNTKKINMSGQKNKSILQLNLVFILFNLFVLNSSNIFTQTGWYNMNVSFGGGGIYFKDFDNGIVGNYKTTNNGSTWLFMGIFSGGSSLSFLNQNTGYGVLSNSILKTTNFGENWVSQNNPSSQFLNGIIFPDVNTGFACGDGGTLIKTTNGGSNWFAIEPLPFPLGGAYYFRNVFFTNTLTGFVAGYRNADTSVFIKTTNGGINWTTQRFTITNWGRFTSMFFLNANTGYIGATSNGNILKTTDGGIGWFSVLVPTTNTINSLYFPSPLTGYASCYGGQVLKTSNSGNNWYLQTTGTGSILNSIFFINNLTGYVTGDNNTLLKTTDGGGAPIGITPISNEVPVDFRLEQNYPNPFNPTTNINFSIPKAGFTSIKIYDITGRLVQTLFEEQLAPGSYKAEWNASQMPSGIYIYRIESGSFTQSRKMILIK